MYTIKKIRDEVTGKIRVIKEYRDMGLNFTKELIKHAENNFEVVSADEYKRRLDICGSCEFFTENSRCSECKCFMTEKARWASAQCGIKPPAEPKWLPVINAVEKKSCGGCGKKD